MALARAVRRSMLLELLHREDLLPSSDWPWYTAQIEAAYAQLVAERAARG